MTKENFAKLAADLFEEARKLAHMTMQSRNKRTIMTNFIGSEGTEVCFSGDNNEGYQEDITSIDLINLITDEMIRKIEG